MKGIIGKKIGMTSVFTPDGKQTPCTIIEAGPCTVTQVKTQATDGYNATQIAFGEKKEKHSNDVKHNNEVKRNHRQTYIIKTVSIQHPMGHHNNAPHTSSPAQLSLTQSSYGKVFGHTDTSVVKSSCPGMSTGMNPW